MEANIELDAVLDLVWTMQEGLAERIDAWPSGSVTHSELWEVYKEISGLYDDIRRAAK